MRNLILFILLLIVLNNCSFLVDQKHLKEIENKLEHDYNKSLIINFINEKGFKLTDNVIERIIFLSKLYWRPVLECPKAIFTESSGKQFAIGRAKEKGFVQLMSPTARENGTKIGYKYYVGIEFDPIFSVDVWFYYTQQLQNKFNGDRQKAILAYNMGPGRLQGFIDNDCTIDQIKYIVYHSKGWKPYDEKIL